MIPCAYNFAKEGDRVLSAQTTVIVKSLHPSSSLNLDLANSPHKESHFHTQDIYGKHLDSFLIGYFSLF